MTLTASPNQALTAYVDADWVYDPDDFISVTGFLIYFGPSLISWTGKKQKLVTLLSKEAEFIALCDVTREILWLQQLLETFKVPDIKKNTLIYEDNLLAINLANNEQTKGRTKHLSIKLRFVHQNLQLGKIYFAHIASINNVADLLTKSLSKKLFMQHRKSIVISSLGKISTF